MVTPERHILATSGGWTGPSTGPYRARPGPLLTYGLELTGKQRPKLCFLTTAGGDNNAEIAMGYNAFASRDDVAVSHLELFVMPNVHDPREHLLSQDMIWVGGGSVANLLAVWRAHGLDTIMREAWEAGIVLAGVSAGSICWHVGGTTDSFGLDLRAVTDGLALVPYSNGVHYDSEERRRPLFHRLIGDGTLPAGFATDDGVGLHYVGTDFREALSERKNAAAYWVERTADGVDE
ncbi:MAG: peptidase E, partial [Frankiaceae bacterium]|nr:peptidase E [Frankiaceae bacterium]